MHNLVCTIKCALFSVPSPHADKHLLSDRGDTSSTSSTWLFRQQDLEEKDESVNEVISDGGVCRTAPATPGLLNIVDARTLHLLD